MREKLTKSDVEKIRAEIEHRKLVERKELIEAVLDKLAELGVYDSEIELARSTYRG